jgi:hypothetical protein
MVVKISAHTGGKEVITDRGAPSSPPDSKVETTLAIQYALPTQVHIIDTAVAESLAGGP